MIVEKIDEYSDPSSSKDDEGSVTDFTPNSVDKNVSFIKTPKKSQFATTMNQGSSE